MKGTWWRDFSTGDPGRFEEKALETGISIGAPLSILWTLKDERRRALGMGNLSLSLRGSSVRGTRRGAPLLVTPKIWCVRFWKWTSVSTWAPLWGKMEGRFHRAFEKRDKF